MFVSNICKSLIFYVIYMDLLFGNSINRFYMIMQNNLYFYIKIKFYYFYVQIQLYIYKIIFDLSGVYKSNGIDIMLF